MTCSITTVKWLSGMKTLCHAEFSNRWNFVTFKIPWVLIHTKKEFVSEVWNSSNCDSGSRSRFRLQYSCKSQSEQSFLLIVSDLLKHFQEGQNTSKTEEWQKHNTSYWRLKSAWVGSLYLPNFQTKINESYIKITSSYPLSMYIIVTHMMSQVHKIVPGIV